MASTNRVSRSIPQGTVDTNEASARGGRYGEQYVAGLHGARHFLADEGSYFVGTSPTPGTAIALTTSITTFAESAGAVAGSLFIKNTESKTASFPKRIYLDYIKLICLGPPTTAVNWLYAMVLDDNPVRYTSGGSAITPANPNGDSSATSIATVYFGALTTAVTNNKRLVARGNLKGTIPVIYDTFIIVAGGAPGGAYSAATTVPSSIVDTCPPIIIGAQQNFLLSLWGIGSAAAPTFELEMGWWER